MIGHLYVGIDAGSSATKCVAIDEAGALLGHCVVPSGFSYEEAAATALAGALEDARVDRDEISCCVSTGYGREWVPFAARRLTEITCHARGAREWYPDGRPASEGTYEDGQRNGRWTFWREDGTVDPERSGLYQGGRRVGEA